MITDLSHFPQAVLLSGGNFHQKIEKMDEWMEKLLPEMKKFSQSTTLQCKHPDVLILPQEDINKNKIKIDDVRRVISHFGLSAHQGSNKIAVLLNADSMSIEACNALLKILEEPPPKSYIFLLSDYPHLLPITLLSRCWKLTLNSVEHKNPDPHHLAIKKEITNLLVSVQENKISVFHAGEKCQKIDFLTVLDVLYDCCMDFCIKNTANQKIFDWLDLINETRGQILKKQNPNQMLALENIFYHWKLLS